MSELSALSKAHEAYGRARIYFTQDAIDEAVRRLRELAKTPAEKQEVENTLKRFPPIPVD